MNTHMNTEEDRLKEALEGENYVQTFDTHKPKFVGLPDGYYRNSKGNIVRIILMWLFVHGIATGLFALCLALLNLNTKTVSWVFTGIFLAYIATILLCIYCGESKRKEL